MVRAVLPFRRPPSTTPSSSAMAFPIELVALILARLPVKSLVRFKTVSKEWYSLISSAFFVVLHIGHTPVVGHSDDRHLIVLGKEVDGPWYLERRALDSQLTRLSKFFLPSYPDKDEELVDFRCSCNGLIILEHSYMVQHWRGFQYRLSELIMCNPLFNNYFVLPDPKIPRFLTSYAYFGFGYDKLNNDFKLLRLFYPHNEIGGSCSWQVYSLKRNCWGPSVIKDTGSRHWKTHSALIDNHIIHWFFKDYHDETLLRGFDICSEEWLDVPLPAGQDGYLDIGVLDNCLCISSYSERGDKVHVWLMKEYGVKESWTKLFNLSHHHSFHVKSFGHPIAYSSKGDKLLMRMLGTDSSCQWYDLKDKIMTPVSLRLWPTSINHCTATLFPVPKEDGVTSCFIQQMPEH